MSVAFAAPQPVTIPIRGSELRFPVRRIYCVGRNYNEHVKEMGGVVGRDPPFFFMKPNDAVVTDGRFPYPSASRDVHHEVELVVALGMGGKVFGHAVGLDMTRRDLQNDAKKLGRPWEVAKSFDKSGPSGPLVPAAKIGHPDAGAVMLKVNGEVRQQGDLNQMLWKVPEMIATLSQFFELQPGDIIMSGTPSGVGPIERGDVMVASVDGVGEITITVN